MGPGFEGQNVAKRPRGTERLQRSRWLSNRLVSRPVLWHIMKLHAHYGFWDFVLCLGYCGHMIKDCGRLSPAGSA